MNEKQKTFEVSLMHSYDCESFVTQGGFATREEAFAWGVKSLQEKWGDDDSYIAVRRETQQ